MVTRRPLTPSVYLQLMRLTAMLALLGLVMFSADQWLPAGALAVGGAALTVWLYRRFRRS